MPYSVMLWLVHPEPGAPDCEREPSVEAGRRSRARLPGAASGFTAPPPVTRLSFGLFESEVEMEDALTVIAESLRQNAPLRVSHGNRTFLVPAQRVHYVVCDEVTRPKDRDRPGGP